MESNLFQFACESTKIDFDVFIYSQTKQKQKNHLWKIPQI